MKESLANPSGYKMPKPTRLFLLDDISMGNPKVKQNLETLRKCVDARRSAVVADVPTLAKRLRRRYERALARREVSPIDLTVAVGNAGEQVAELLQFGVPQIRVNPTRRAGEDGMPFIKSKTGIPLEEEVNSALAKLPKEFLPSFQTIGIVDDTIFFGATMKSVVGVLERVFPKAQFIALSLTYVMPFAKANVPGKVDVVSGFTLRTNQGQKSGLNSINAKDFIVEDALPLVDGSSIPFMQEENWMTAWFGENYEKAINICQDIKRSLYYNRRSFGNEKEQ